MPTGRGDDVQVKPQPAAIAAVGVKWNAAVHSAAVGTIFLYFSFYEAKKDMCWRRWPVEESSGDPLIFHRDL